MAGVPTNHMRRQFQIHPTKIIFTSADWGTNKHFLHLHKQKTMETFNGTVVAFNLLIQQNNFIDALHRFYDDEVVSADNLNPPHVGKAALKAEVENFMANATIHKIELVSVMIENNLSVTNWYYNFDPKKLGEISAHQLSVQRWKNNKIIQENHFYNI